MKSRADCASCPPGFYFVKIIVMNNDLSQIEFYFPEGDFSGKEEMVDKTISLMQESGSIDYCGYANTDLLRKGLMDHVGNGDVKKYTVITDTQKNEIERTISETIEKSNNELKVPTKNFVFVHPYLTTEEDSVFDGVMAVAVYSCVFYVFVDLKQFTKESLENTVAHELNHTIYYYHHYDDFGAYTLLDNILLEGLAENFREQYFDSEITKWAGALSKEEALSILKSSDGDSLDTRDEQIIKDFLFGSKEYKRWTGYSVGYWLVKKFRSKNQNLDWEELMRLQPKNFLEAVK